MACQKEEEVPVADEQLPKLTAKIDNVVWEADESIMAVIDNKNGENQLTIFSTNKKEELLSLNAINVTGTGTYTYATNRDENNGQFSRTWMQHYYSLFTDDFTLTVTKFDKSAKKISGTFSFHAEAAFDESVINITDGNFTDVPFEVH